MASVSVALALKSHKSELTMFIGRYYSSPINDYGGSKMGL
jgi:hypothetical protein